MKENQPTIISDINFHRLLIAIIIVLALMAGFYQSSLVGERKKYAKLEDLYVRVRQQLGREETQRLIERSYEDSNN